MCCQMCGAPKCLRMWPRVLASSFPPSRDSHTEESNEVLSFNVSGPCLFPPSEGSNEEVLSCSLTPRIFACSLPPFTRLPLKGSTQSFLILISRGVAAEHLRLSSLAPAAPVSPSSGPAGEAERAGCGAAVFTMKAECPSLSRTAVTISFPLRGSLVCARLPVCPDKNRPAQCSVA